MPTPIVLDLCVGGSDHRVNFRLERMVSVDPLFADRLVTEIRSLVERMVDEATAAPVVDPTAVDEVTVKPKPLKPQREPAAPPTAVQLPPRIDEAGDDEPDAAERHAARRTERVQQRLRARGAA